MNTNDRYSPIIGMEIHVELATNSKMFCSCSATHFNVKPNTHTCPVCLGLPGALPVPNKKAIDWTVMIGLAVDCEIKSKSKFDRKHYFYPDLPKGYQISQYDQPLCENGKMTIDNGHLIRINRVHLEEDTGKLVHATVKNQKVSLVDFNRSGVPLVEIVTEPDIYSSAQAKEYVKAIQTIIRYLGVSDCDMEKGSMRLEANISLAKGKGQRAKGSNRSTRYALSSKLPSYKVEVKNLNSFRFLEKAIDYEIDRQSRILDQGKTPAQETRGWDEAKKQTVSQRSKEEAQDYRYFPEPDIPPLKLEPKLVKSLERQLPELPKPKIKRFITDYQIPQSAAQILATSRQTADYFEEAIKVGKKHKLTPKAIANAIVNKHFDINKHLPAKLIKFLVKKATSQVSDDQAISAWVDQVISDNAQAVKDFKKGKSQVIGFLIGQVQRLARGQANAQLTSKLLLEALQKSS